MTFFSGTDTATLRSEGNDTNCFVSLIVNNSGPYCAAITRKKQTSVEVVTKSLGTSYEFFGEGAIKTDEDPMSETTRVIDKEVIEYFMLDVQVEKVENHLEYLDARFEEIEAKKKASVVKRVYNPVKGDTELKRYDEEDKQFLPWLHSSRKESAEAKESLYSEPTLFDKETMDDLIDFDWRPDPTIIHYLACQLVTCSLIVNKDIDLKQWIVKHMEKKYDEIFGSDKAQGFNSWADSYVEFILDLYSDSNVPVEMYEDWDNYIGMIASALEEELCTYPANKYIDAYVKKLGLYVV